MWNCRSWKIGQLSLSAMALSGLLNIFMPVSMAIDPACDFFQEMIMGQVCYIYNVAYPAKYGNSTSCRWAARSEVGTKIVLACEDVDLPSTSNCQGDRLRVSLTGHEDFSDSKNYCGKGSISLATEANSLAVGLFSTSNTPGGKFLCSLTAILISEEEPSKPAQVCDCGWKKGTRIFGGNATLVNEYPSMAGLIDFGSSSLYCGGSIISNRFILTAGHCVFKKTAASIGVLVGDHNISTGLDTAAAALYKVSAYEIHPDYNFASKLNDIALLRTTETIKFSMSVGPVCLPFRYTPYDFYGQEVAALGWGQIEYTGPTSDVLQKVDLQVTSNAYCANQHGEETITGSQICTYSPGKDACQSDSGGPLLWMDTSKRKLQLIGVISYGLGCGSQKPGVNTRVTSFLSWIVSRTADANYCIM